AVRPILATAFPSLRYSAALIGYGSDVLGYDTVRSTDHEWGPRLLLFVAEQVYADVATHIREALSQRLPRVFHGYSTHFGAPDAEGVQVRAVREAGPVDHKVEVHTPRQFCLDRLGVDPRGGLSIPDWLSLPQQKLLEFTAGRVYHDGLGELGEIRAQLARYPHDAWLYLLAAQWQRISQQEPFVGRAGEVGDEIGSHLVAESLVRDLMRLCFLMARRYAPYTKWFGMAFSRLDAATALTPSLQGVLRAGTWQERERHLCAAYEAVARLHNALRITEPLAEHVSFFHGRPFRVIHGDRFASAISDVIADQEVRNLVQRVGLIGAIDQITDNVDVLSDPGRYVTFRALYA
ncbi:MAG: DUF4037 domain-containing protein, partial [Chloroflexota bacterium]|nr:DUF4037 domain-containing protein [Chloroflexota bacterium]